MDALNMTELERTKALREVRILHTLKHPNIIGYKDSYLDDEGALEALFPCLRSSLPSLDGRFFVHHHGTRGRGGRPPAFADAAGV
jgi:serine/threonine protein kinase